MSSSNKIDVVMPTWNSGGPLFEITVKVLLKTLGDRLHHFIVVDRFSSDNTLEILRKYVGEKLIVIQTEANLALARKIGLHFADTEVVFMVDSDVVVNKSFLELGLSVLKRIKKVGVVAAPLCGHVGGRDFKLSRVIIPIELVKTSWLVRYSLDTLVRGYTFAILIKKSLANDWIPLPNLSAYEDYSLSQHILRKGFYWVEIEPCVRHLKELKVGSQTERLFKQGLWEGSNARKVLPLLLALVNAILRLLFGIRSRDFLRRLGYVIGLLTGVYDVWKRT